MRLAAVMPDAFLQWLRSLLVFWFKEIRNALFGVLWGAREGIAMKELAPRQRGTAPEAALSRPEARGGASRIDSECSVRKKARDAIRSGKLPTHLHGRTLAGPGGGRACAVCGEPIKQNQVEYEIEFRLHGGLTSYHFHLRCFAAWEMECRHEVVRRAAAVS